MDMSVSKKDLSADSCEVEARTACGIVYLRFINTLKGVHCVARSTYVKGCSTKLPRQDFLAARFLAIKAMNKTAKEEQVPNGGNKLSDTDIARAILAQEDVRTRRCSVGTALDVFLESAKWCDSGRRFSILQEIGKIGGKASSRRAKLRQKNRRKKEEEARQGDLFD